jgi:hypothetical protein
LRGRFELHGETLMALAIESGDANRIGVELAGLGQLKRQEIVEWLASAAIKQNNMRSVLKPWNGPY